MGDQRLVEPGAVNPIYGRGLLAMPTPKSVWSSSVATPGPTTLYTCPTGKKAIVGYMWAFNPTVTNTTLNLYIGSNVAANQWESLVCNAGVSTGVWMGMLLNAGDTLTAASTAAQVNMIHRVWEFPASEPIVGAKVNSVNGAQLLYTCPAGKCARTLNDLWSCYNAFGFNTNVGSAGVQASYLLSGGVIQALSNLQTFNGKSGFYWGFQYPIPYVNAGDSVYVSANTTGVNVWAVFLEHEL